MTAYRMACACGNYDELIVADGEPEPYPCPVCGAETSPVESSDDPPWVSDDPPAGL